MQDDNKLNLYSKIENDIKKDISANDDEAILKNNAEINPKKIKGDLDDFKNQNLKAQNADTSGIP